METMGFPKLVRNFLTPDGENLQATAAEIKRLTPQDRHDLATWAHREMKVVITGLPELVG